MKNIPIVAALCLLVASCTWVPDRGTTPAPESAITLASWNMEHLAERNDSGCRPRTDADYAAMRAYAESLGADVIAFQEVESRAAAERVFDPSTYTIEIEQRVGTNRNGACGGDGAGLTINAQRTGFAIRKGIRFERQHDFTALQVGNPDLRSGVDVIVRPTRGTPMRLLSVHLRHLPFPLQQRKHTKSSRLLPSLSISRSRRTATVTICVPLISSACCVAA